MSTPRQFLEIELRKLANKFLKIQCSYEFHNMTDAHYVEILPSSEYNKETLKSSIAEILISFYEYFPGESLVFLTDEDGINFKAEFQIKGIEYLRTWNCLLLESKSSYKPEPILAEDLDQYCDFSYALAA